MNDYNFEPLKFSDKNGNDLQLGDLVESVKGKYKGLQCYFVFCIPQHRFGFLYFESYDKYKKWNKEGQFDNNILPKEFIIDVPNVDFYYTPRTKQEIIKL